MLGEVAAEMEADSEEVIQAGAGLSDQVNNSAGDDSVREATGLTRTLLGTLDISRGETGVNSTGVLALKTCTRGDRATAAETWVDLAQCGDQILTDNLRMEDKRSKL